MNSTQDINQRRSALSAEKQALLRERLRGAGRTTQDRSSQTIPKQSTASKVLSFSQQRLWFLDQLVPGSPFYTESSALRMRTAISVPAFQRALNEVIRRHEVLRTTFPLIGEQPAAIVSPDANVPVHVEDLTTMPFAQRDAEVLRLATDDVRLPFDLERGPLLRVTLVRLGMADWVLLLSMHHIICDAWSSSIFSRELSEIYLAYVSGKPSPLPDLPIQYSDFAHWQHSYLTGELMERQLSYWRKQLADLPQLSLPADFRRPAVFSFRGAHHHIDLSSSLSASLKRLSQETGATLFMILFSGFMTLLHRYTAQDDLVVGVPVANRNRRELESLIGFFVNILIMRKDLSGNPTHRHVIERIKLTALDAYAHQDLPFEKLVDDLHPQRDLARNPLFQVIFQLHENPDGFQPRSGLSTIEVNRATVKFDLRLDFFQQADGLKCVIEYSTDLFTPDRIDRFGQHLRTTYEAMAREPDSAIGSFALVTGAEKTTLHRWSGRSEYSRHSYDTTICDRFEEQRRARPEAQAMVMNQRSVTYAELGASADAVAAILEAKGVRPDELVAVTGDLRFETVVALLGILKAGAAYMPLNSAYPDERLHYMLQDGSVRFLVDTAGARSRYEGFDVETIPLVLNNSSANSPRSRAESNVTPEHLAYVMYTSGSTGIPKGVCVSHRAVVRLVTQANYCPMGPGETFLMLAPATFDASTLEVWAPLLNGGRLVVYPEDRVSPDDLAQVMKANGVTVLWITTGLFHQVVEARPDAFVGLRQVMTGGDVLSPSHVKAYMDHNTSTLINCYGPTENTTFTTCHVIARNEETSGAIPIGKPISGTYVHVVDRYGQLSPIGVPGELLTGGEGVARGYLNDPALTAERFVPDPFASDTGRMYRTGDCVQILADGALEFLGRMDRQVKVRGFRVEPGEIEKALTKHPAVLNASVIATEAQSGDKRLTAYVVLKNPGSNGNGDLWQHAETTLLSDWQTLYEDLYAAGSNGAEASFDLSGWTTSETGDPIPADEMTEWLHATLERIDHREQSSVFEIGCGTGLLAYRLAPQASRYVGADFSPSVIDRLRRGLAAIGLDSPRAELLVQPAHDFTGVDRETFDTVIINSVAQYLPTADYLFRVLQGAVEATAAGGKIVVGDVRHLSYLGPFHAGVEMSRAQDELPANEIRRRVEKWIRLEHELLIDPAFFEALRQSLPRITRVDIQWKRGRSENELTRYRYDVVLHVDHPYRQADEIRTLSWTSDALTLEKLSQVLRDERADVVCLEDVPNSRVWQHVKLWKRLLDDHDAYTVADLRSILGEPDATFPHLDDLWKIADDSPYVAHVQPDGPESLETCTVYYVRQTVHGIPLIWRAAAQPSKPWTEYTNRPATRAVAENLTPELRRHLQTMLPEYMVPSSVIMVDTIPLTHNGKIDREALSRFDLERPATNSHYAPARTDIENRLVQVWAGVLGVERVGINDNFFELGGDSILSIQATSRAKAAGVNITVKQIFENQTIAKLASVATEGPAIHREQGTITGPTGLTSAQAWLLHQDLPRVDHFNQSILLQVPRNLNTAALEQSLRAITRHHDALRLRCERKADGWRLFYQDVEPRQMVERVDLRGADQKRAELEKHCARVQAGLDLAKGPVLRAVLYDLGWRDGGRLLLAAHHFVVDGVSWRILLEDLWTAYSQFVLGNAISLPEKTTSMHFWTQKLAAFAESDELLRELAFWRSIADGKTSRLPVDHDGPNTVATVRVIHVELSEDDTRAVLTEVPKHLHTQVNDVLLTSLAHALGSWTREPFAYFDLEGHGRESLFDDVDLSRTVGWFTSIFPVRLELDPSLGIQASVKAIRSQLEQIPRRGVGFGILRYLSSNPEVRAVLDALPKRDLSFNYLGQFRSGSNESEIRGATESAGPMRDPNGNREYLIEIDSVVAGDRLTFDLSYSEALHDRQSIENLANNIIGYLREIVADCRGGATVISPADFPAARIDQDDLARLLAELDASEL